VAAQEGGGAAGTDAGKRETFLVRAAGSSGSVHDTDTDDRGRFTLMLAPNDSYVMSFSHRETTSGAMHFAGYMVFGCGASESDHFFVNGRERAVELGTVIVSRDGSFARPERNPMDQVDRDRDGTPDSRDSDTQCAKAGDRNHDGFYDDDMDHDGHHDDDMDEDGHHDCEMGDMDMGHDDEDDDCPAAGMTRTPEGTPEMTPTPEPTAIPATATPDGHAH
jgi:hypothetical protein